MKEIQYDPGPYPRMDMYIHDYQEAFMKHEMAKVVAKLNESIREAKS